MDKMLRPVGAPFLRRLLRLVVLPGTLLITCFLPAVAEAGVARSGKRFPAFQSCVTGRMAVAERTPCTTLSTPQETPLHLDTAALAISPTGDNLYASGHVTGRVSNFIRDPVSGGLSFHDCVIGGTNDSQEPCSAIRTAPQYSDTGLADPGAVALSPDGRSVYVLATGDKTIATFARDPATGALSFRQCLGGPNPEPSDLPCTPLPGGGKHHLSLLTEPADLAVSPDGRSVYVTSVVGGVVEFSRAAATGDLIFQGCLTDTQTVRGCRRVRGPGMRPPIDYGTDIEISPDGRLVFTLRGAVIVAFGRDRQDGSLSYRSCTTSALRRRPDFRVRGCSFFPGRRDFDVDDFVSPIALALSPDGRWLYAGSIRGTVASFRISSRGRLEFRECVTANWLAKKYCRTVPGARHHPKEKFGASGTLAIAPDGRHLYSGSLGGSSLASFGLFKNGRLRFEGCVSGSTRLARAGFIHCKEISGASSNGSLSSLRYVAALAVSPDSRWVYAGSSPDQSLVAFHR